MCICVNDTCKYTRVSRFIKKIILFWIRPNQLTELQIYGLDQSPD